MKLSSIYTHQNSSSILRSKNFSNTNLEQKNPGN
jgi:hypothetical protein